MGAAVVLVGYVALLIGYQSYQQHRLTGAWNSDHPVGSIADATFNPNGAQALGFRPHLADGEPVARLRIPSIGFDAIVTEGANGGLLTSGPGHDDRTGYPGENRVILIGNHNGFSLSWNDIKPGARVVVEMAYGRYSYSITRRLIVDGDDTTVLSQGRSTETLLLSTCWPLWQGAIARQRLVFEAVPAGVASA
jgi:sortase A